MDGQRLGLAHVRGVHRHLAVLYARLGGRPRGRERQKGGRGCQAASQGPKRGAAGAAQFSAARTAALSPGEPHAPGGTCARRLGHMGSPSHARAHARAALRVAMLRYACMRAAGRARSPAACGTPPARRALRGSMCRPDCRSCPARARPHAGSRPVKSEGGWAAGRHASVPSVGRQPAGLHMAAWRACCERAGSHAGACMRGQRPCGRALPCLRACMRAAPCGRAARTAPPYRPRHSASLRAPRRARARRRPRPCARIQTRGRPSATARRGSAARPRGSGC